MMPLVALKSLPWRLIAAGLLMAGLALQTVRLADSQTDLAETKQRNAEALKGISDLATTAAEKAVASLAAWNALVADIDTAYSRGKDDALNDNETRRAAVARGDQRLRIAATCPAASSGDLPQAAATTGVDAQTTVELAPATGQAVFDLRAALIADRAALAGLQAYVTQVCPGP